MLEEPTGAGPESRWVNKAPGLAPVLYPTSIPNGANVRHSGGPARPALRAGRPEADAPGRSRKLRSHLNFL